MAHGLSHGATQTLSTFPRSWRPNQSERSPLPEPSRAVRPWTVGSSGSYGERSAAGYRGAAGLGLSALPLPHPEPRGWRRGLLHPGSRRNGCWSIWNSGLPTWDWVRQPGSFEVKPGQAPRHPHPAGPPDWLYAGDRSQWGGDSTAPVK